MSFYLAEYDVDYTADHHQSVEDVPGVPDITLNMAVCTASGRRGEGRGQEERNRGVRSTKRVLMRNNWKRSNDSPKRSDEGRVF